MQNAKFLEGLTYDKTRTSQGLIFFVLENDDVTWKPRIDTFGVASSTQAGVQERSLLQIKVWKYKMKFATDNVNSDCESSPKTFLVERLKKFWQVNP